MPAPAYRYRFSARTIRNWTKVLTAAVFIVPVAGLIYGSTLDSSPEPWQELLVQGLLYGGIVVPLLIAAVLGGEAIWPGGGFIGALFVAGLIGGSLGVGNGIQWLAITGFVAAVLGVGGFFAIGFAAKVPMWIGSRKTSRFRWNLPE
ncbi:hypothetical protein QMG83_12345 [Salinibacterium sp. G-O1]|uniref:hypothetical protein n=1 Tax=Salinibacterium sp. G-O1 TaxID=3046208 RepID=UPI0024B9EE57|nr:hypothetical protein [Salinibacterium sp. G-O1]MDJ0336016.1 hypothetical protein [Salinibacterium sp. G-O1]